MAEPRTTTPLILNNELRAVNAGGNQTDNKGPGGFSATSNQLAAGKYTLDFYASQTAFAQDVKPTPEPATLISALVGGGALLILNRRRRPSTRRCNADNR